MRELIEDVKGLDSLPEMSARVSRSIEEALHPERILLFHREEAGGDMSLGYSSGGASREVRIPGESRLLAFMEERAGAQDFPFQQKNELPSAEKEWLAALGASLVVAVGGTDGRLAWNPPLEALTEYRFHSAPRRGSSRCSASCS